MKPISQAAFYKKIIFGAVALAALSGAQARAATMSFTVDPSRGAIGDTISVSVRIDTQGQTVNAAQGTIAYPKDLLSVQRVDHGNSVFNIWAQEPSVNSSTGEIGFLAGSGNAYSGASLYVFNIIFTARGSGSGDMSFKTAGVTAGDGTGANVLSGTTPAPVVIGGSGTTPSPLPTSPGSPVVAPVSRPAVAATGLPAKPVLRVPLYPDQGRWYSRLGDTAVFWDLPSDVTQVSTRLSHAPDAAPGKAQPQLTTGQDFGILGNGVWYIRAQFGNGVGFGPFAYYKISIDTAPPLPFTVTFDGPKSDNPTPQIRYGTNDSFAGVSNYEVIVDHADPIQTASSSITLPPQNPGVHAVLVRAFDAAGNSAEATSSFEILPLPLPSVDSLTRRVAQGGQILVSGRVTAGESVDVKLVDQAQRIVSAGTAPSDAAGNWGIAINQPLGVGTYSLTATARDSRGASSDPTESQPVQIAEATVLAIGSLAVTRTDLLLAAIIAIVMVIAIMVWRVKKGQRKRAIFNTIAVRDVEKLCTLIEKDLEDMQERQAASGTDSRLSRETAAIMERTKGDVAKMRKYLSIEVQKIE